MRVLRFALLSLSLSALQGCATLSEGQCYTGDWFGIGNVDARTGYTSDRLSQHNEACAEFGISLEPDAYYAGYQEGLIAFCVPSEAFALGRRGASYYGQCPPGTERDFLPAFELGSDLYAVDQQLLQIEADIERLREDGQEENISDDALEAIDAALGSAKRERRVRSEDRNRIIDRAQRRGYGEVW
jgi:hypothetical protein